jgi:hypothetical protein
MAYELLTGSGRADWVPDGAPLADGIEQDATVLASDLGACDGHSAYRAVGWFFHQHGEALQTHGSLNACTGF